VASGSSRRLNGSEHYLPVVTNGSWLRATCEGDLLALDYQPSLLDAIIDAGGARACTCLNRWV
jgi:hypothetical protein